jgi:hypothetical protein
MPSKSELSLSDKPSNLEQRLDVRAKNACVLGENTGTSGLELMVRCVVAILDHDIPAALH